LPHRSQESTQITGRWVAPANAVGLGGNTGAGLVKLPVNWWLDAGSIRRWWRLGNTPGTKTPGTKTPGMFSFHASPARRSGRHRVECLILSRLRGASCDQPRHSAANHHGSWCRWHTLAGVSSPVPWRSWVHRPSLSFRPNQDIGLQTNAPSQALPALRLAFPLPVLRPPCDEQGKGSRLGVAPGG
jgi:hypothetical protein